jgi:hypothetical protein
MLSLLSAKLNLNQKFSDPLPHPPYLRLPITSAPALAGLVSGATPFAFACLMQPKASLALSKQKDGSAFAPWAYGETRGQPLLLTLLQANRRQEGKGLLQRNAVPFAFACLMQPGVSRPALFFILILPLPAYAAQKGACCPHLGKQGQGRLIKGKRE